MVDNNQEIHIEDDDATAAVSNTGLRWVLAIGLLLAIVFLSLIWMTGALTQGDVEEEATVSGEIASQADDGDDTDSIVSDSADELDAAADADQDTDAGVDVIENEAAE